MKKLLLACMMVIGFGASAQISLGGTSTTTGGLPVDPYWGYTYSQQIYSKAEINASAAGSITGLKFYLNTSASISNSNEWVIYMAHTTKTSFSSLTDWIPLADLTQVYSGVVTKSGGEVTITLDTPFAYNNIDNLVIAVDENKSGLNGITDRFYSYASGISNSSIFYRSDSSNPDPATPPTASQRAGDKSRITILGLTPNPPACPNVTAPAANATGVSLTPNLTWSASSGANSYNISLGTTPGGTDILNNHNVTTTNYTVPAAAGLQYGTTYYLTVTAVNAIGESTGCTERQFTTTTTIPCPTVSAPANNASNVVLTPTFTWSAVNGVQGYRLTIGTTSGGNDILNAQDVGNVTTYTLLTPLNPSTTYYYSIVAYSGTLSSSSCTVRNFTTVCGVLPVPYTHDFASFPGTCWSTMSGGTPANPGTGSGSSNWVSDGFLNSGTSGAASFNIYSSGRAGWLISPTFDLSAGNKRLKFNYGFTNYNSGTAITAMGADDNFQILMSTDGGTTWTSLNIWDASTGTYPNTSTEYIYDLSAVTSSTVKFAFYATSGSVNNSLDYDVHVDNFKIEDIPSCLEPMMISSTAITSDSATIEWTAPSPAPADGYVIYYSTTNTAPTASTVLDATNSLTTTTTSGTITGLSPNTTYYVWVRSTCSSALQSPWAGIHTFTTLCTAFNIPYLENFNSVTTPALPACTSIENLGLGNNWITYSGAGGNFTGNVLNYSYNSNNAANVWFYTPGINLTAGTVYRISYKYGSASTSTYSENLKVAYGTSPSATAMVNPIADHTNILVGNVGADYYYDFTVPASGVYYFGFHAYSAPDMNRLYVDDILIDLAPTCFAPTAVTVENTTPNSVELSWTPPVNGTPQTYEVYLSTTNTPPTAATAPTVTGITGTSVIIPTLLPSTQYYAWVRTSCSATDQSEWSPSVNFSTPCLPPAITSTTGATVCPNNTATLTVDGDAGATFTWYDAATGGTVLGTGNTFTTPALTATTDYWVSAANISNAAGGKITPVSTTGFTSYSNIGLVFDALVPFTLKSVDVYALGTSGSVVNATVAVKTSTGTTVATTTIPVTVSGASTPVTLNLNFAIPVGTDYRLVFDGVTPTTGLSGFVREDSSANISYPYAIGSMATIKSALTGGSPSSSYYYYFYNWQLETVCESDRQMVTATVDPNCLGTSELTIKTDVKVYPNPFKDVINIVNADRYVSGVVADASGRVVRSLAKVEAQINLGNLSHGVYILSLKDKQGKVTSIKLIKE